MTMSEEHACLVRARSDSENSAKLGSFRAHGMAYTDDKANSTEGAGEPAGTTNMAISPPDINIDNNESGELLDYNDASVLEHFHEDALRQAGCGLSQLRVLLACALALAGATLELSAIPFILPSAEIELCILPHEKNWLVLISLVGCSLGSVGWGSLGGRLGRRRALLSCLAVNAVFATIAAFMPTYGTFMMARFCSAIGSGGICPLTFTYTSELVRRSWKRAAVALLLCAGGVARCRDMILDYMELTRVFCSAIGSGGICPLTFTYTSELVRRSWKRAAVALLLCAGGAGSMLSAALAGAVLPHTGADTLVENKEHFSAWHRYLLLCTLPILAALISLIWTQESPRYLLEVAREVDAMMVYQTIHSSNQTGNCGRVRSEYRIGELSLPGKRRALHHVTHNVKQFWRVFYQLFSSPYRKPTLSLGGTLVFIVAIQFYLSAYVPKTVVQMDNQLFDASTLIINNSTYDAEFYNTTKENIEYNNCTFRNCTFRDLIMSHVSFWNCTFINCAMSNIKTSKTWFHGVVFVNTTIIDTDMEMGKELDSWCVFEGSTVRGMQGGCSKHADLTARLSGLIREQAYVSHAMMISSVFALMPHNYRHNVLIAFSIICIMLSPALYVCDTETMLYLLEAAFRFASTIVFMIVTMQIVEDYPANLRCTAHGLILSVTYMVSAVVRGLSSAGGALSAGICAAMAVCALAAALVDR